MHTNIVTFPKLSKARNAGPVETVKDNVIQLSEWRKRVKCHRTQNGVFFSTDVLRSYGCVA